MYKTAKDSRIEISELMLPSHANFGGKIHGGFILKLMDQIAFACASKYSGSYCVTASVDKVNFRKSIEVGELITMKASINYVGKSSMVVGIRVEAENIRTGKTKHCNSSYFTMVAIDESGKTTLVPKLEITSRTDAKRFIKAIKRRENEERKLIELSKIYKNIDQYLEQLKDYRVKINF